MLIFVGLQRGGFGNPFDVTTASGKPLAEDVALSLERSLEARGYVIEVISDLSQATARRVIVLRMVEWKTDIYAQITLHFDLVIQVRNEAGEVVAEKEVKGEEPIGGGKIIPARTPRLQATPWRSGSAVSSWTVTWLPRSSSRFTRPLLPRREGTRTLPPCCVHCLEAAATCRAAS
jgi:hypothetical protein